MKEHMRFAEPIGMSCKNELADPFGQGTAQMPWDDKSDSVENAVARVDVFWNSSIRWGLSSIAFMIEISLLS